MIKKRVVLPVFAGALMVKENEERLEVMRRGNGRAWLLNFSAGGYWMEIEKVQTAQVVSSGFVCLISRMEGVQQALVWVCVYEGGEQNRGARQIMQAGRNRGWAVTSTCNSRMEAGRTA